MSDQSNSFHKTDLTSLTTDLHTFTRNSKLPWEIFVNRQNSLSLLCVDDIELHPLIIVAKAPAKESATTGILSLSRSSDAEAQLAFVVKAEVMDALG
jgi:hypothetical protein